MLPEIIFCSTPAQLAVQQVQKSGSSARDVHCVHFSIFTGPLENPLKLGRSNNGIAFLFMLTIKRLAGVAPEVDLTECKLHSPSQDQQIRQNPLWL